MILAGEADSGLARRRRRQHRPGEVHVQEERRQREQGARFWQNSGGKCFLAAKPNPPDLYSTAFNNPEQRRNKMTRQRAPQTMAKNFTLSARITAQNEKNSCSVQR